MNIEYPENVKWCRFYEDTEPSVFMVLCQHDLHAWQNKIYTNITKPLYNYLFIYILAWLYIDICIYS